MKIEGWFQGIWGRIEFSLTVDKEVLIAFGRVILLIIVTLLVPGSAQLIMQLAS